MIKSENIILLRHGVLQRHQNSFQGLWKAFFCFKSHVLMLRRQCKGRRRMETNGKWDRQMLLQSGPDANLPDCQNWNKWGGTESDTAQAKYRHRVRHRRTWWGSTISYVALTQRHTKSKLSDWQNFMNKTIWKVLRLSGNFASTAIYLFTLKMIRLSLLGNFVNMCKTFWSGNIFSSWSPNSTDLYFWYLFVELAVVTPYRGGVNEMRLPHIPQFL